MSRLMSYPSRAAVYLLILLSLVSAGHAQKQKKSKNAAEVIPPGHAVMWESVDASALNMFEGPGGAEMKPDLSSIKFIKEEKKGHNKKFRISDGSGRVWVAKLGREAQPETAATRLLYGLGYKTEITYLVPTLTIPGKGTFKNVRLEARPDNVKRVGEWKWTSNPFVGTKELQDLTLPGVAVFDLLRPRGLDLLEEQATAIERLALEDDLPGMEEPFQVRAAQR